MHLSPETVASKKAARFRLEHGLGHAPVGDLISFLEEIPDIDVAIINAENGEHGITMHDPQHNLTVIAAATTTNPMRQRSSLAHELAHALFQDWNTPATERPSRETSPEETRANAFARHFLIPELGLKDLFTDVSPVLDLEDLSRVVQRFQVSPSIAAIALHSAGLIDHRKKREWMGLTTPNLAIRFGWIGDYRVLQNRSQQPRPPQKLVARAIRGYELGAVTSQTVATLLGTTKQQVEAEFDAAGISPRQATSTPAKAWPEVTLSASELDDLLSPRPADP